MPGLDIHWRKSSFSGSNGGECLEAADRDGAVLVRDTKEHGRGLVHRYMADEWRAFVAAVKTAR